MASASRALLLSKLSPLPAAASRLLRPLAAAGSLLPAALWSAPTAAPGLTRFFATQPATSSLRDSSPNWSNRPPKETILLDGCDFEHWLVVMEPPPGDAGNPDITRDEIIDGYIKTLAQVVGSEQEARQKIYSVSTRHYFAFGALVSEELSYKIKELPKVRWVLPDSYLDVKNKDYGGEPFINGEAVPYDPKYHEEWVRNNALANQRSRRNDRPRNFDRSRNFERRRENMQNFQNRDAPPGQGFNSPPPPGQNQMPPRDAPPMHHAQGNMPQGESELEDTGSKVSSNGNARKDADALQEMEDENEMNKMQEDSKMSNSEVAEQGMNGESNSNNASSGVVEEAETKHSPMPSDDKASDEKPDDSSVLNEKVEDDKILDEKAEDDKASDEKVSSVEKSLRDDCNNLLSYCSFARVPTRPRSLLANRNGAPAHGEIAVAEQVDLVSSEEVPQMAIDEAATDSSLTKVQAENKYNRVCLEHTDPSTACNQTVEQVRFQEKETQIETEDMSEQNNIAQHFAVQETKKNNGLSPTLASHQNSLKLQVEERIQIYNIDTPPQDEDLIDLADKGKAVDVELLPNIRAEAVATMEEEKLGQSSSFKICDLNLVGSPDVLEIRNDPGLGQHSTAGCSMEAQNQQQLDFGTTVGNDASNTDRYAQIPLDNKAVQVIDIEDDSPIEASACDTSKAKSEMIYSSMENMMNPAVNTDVLPDIQDGYNLAISDYLGADMPCYQSIQTDIHAEMGLNDSRGITVMDDPIYGSLSDIGFMEVWDQPPQDYEKFF